MSCPDLDSACQRRPPPRGCERQRSDSFDEVTTPYRLSRAELHRLIWASPVTAVAKQFGVSDVAVGKVCRTGRSEFDS